jgi:hypothetical protein
VSDDLLNPERWLPVTDMPAYEVSDYGRVKRVIGTNASPAGRVLVPTVRERLGYLSVCLAVDKKPRGFLVHRLVCRAFHGPAPEGKPHVAHWDGNLKNNHADNLRWVDPKENASDKIRHGRILFGERAIAAKLTDIAVADIRAAPRRRGMLKQLAEKYGVSQRSISAVRSHETWKGAQ